MTTTSKRPVQFLLVALLVALALIACRREPERFVLDVYPVDYRSTDHGVTVSMDTILFRPGYDVSEGALMNQRRSSGIPTLRIEGALINENPNPVKVFLTAGPVRSNAELHVGNEPSTSSVRPASTLLVDGAQYVEQTVDGQRSDHYLVPANTEFPLLLLVQVPEFGGGSDLRLTFERVEFSESSAVEELSYPGIEVGGLRQEEFDPFNAGW